MDSKKKQEQLNKALVKEMKKEMKQSKKLKAKAIVKNCCAFAPVILSLSGLFTAFGFFLGWGVNYRGAIDQFKKTPEFIAVREVDEEKLKNDLQIGSITSDEFSKKLEKLKFNNYAEAVMKQVGEPGKPYIERLNLAKQLLLSTISGGAVVAIGLSLIYPWAKKNGQWGKLLDQALDDKTKAFRIYQGVMEKREKLSLNLSKEKEIESIEDVYKE